MRLAEAAQSESEPMAEVKLVNVKKIYPFISGEEKKKSKKKKDDEPVKEKANLQITDKGVVAVQEFNLDIADKEFIVLVGPSGCGKSTTLRMIAGLEEITEGELYIDGKEATLPTLVKKSEAKLEGSANGVLTQVYYDEDANKGEGEIIITEISTYVATVQSVTKASSTADRSIKLSTKSNPGTMDYKYETEDFAAKDLVTYTAAYNDSAKKYEIQSVKLLEKSASGLLTEWKGSAWLVGDKGNSKSNFTVDGTTYKYSAKSVVDNADGAKLDNGVADFEVNKSDINVYLDAYGYAIYVSGVEGTKYYAAVIGIGKSNQYGSETKGVTLLLPDGTTKEVKAKLASGFEWTTAFMGKDKTNKWSDTNENLVTDGVADIVTYTEEDGIYKLTPVANYVKNANTTTTTIKVAFTIVADAAFGADTTIDIGYSNT